MGKKKCEGWGSWTRVKSDFHSKCWRVLFEIKHGHMGPYCVYILGFAKSNMSRMSLITTEATWGFALLFHTPDNAHRKFSRKSRICTYYWHTTRLKYNPINLFIFKSIESIYIYIHMYIINIRVQFSLLPCRNCPHHPAPDRAAASSQTRSNISANTSTSPSENWNCSNMREKKGIHQSGPWHSCTLNGWRWTHCTWLFNQPSRLEAKHAKH